MDDLEQKSDEELWTILKKGVNLLPHIPQSESNRAKRILDYRKSIREMPLVTPITNEVRIFLSYSTKNKVGVGKIKSWLSNFGFNVFLAHEDIEPSLEWQKVITKNLKECNVFIPIITSYFNESLWTDQESGMAFMADKLIIPVSVDHGPKPHGFIAIYQALPLDSNEIEKGCVAIVKTIRNDPRYSSLVLDLLLNKLKESHSYASAEQSMSLICGTPLWTKGQFDTLINIAKENNQVSYAAGFRNSLPELIKKYPKFIDPILIRELNDIDEDFNYAIPK